MSKARINPPRVRERIAQRKRIARVAAKARRVDRTLKADIKTRSQE